MRKVLGASFLALAVCGCAGGGKADVSGVVTYKGKPVTLGTVVVVGSDGISIPGTIQADGKYVVNGVAPGPVKIAVISRKPTGGKKSAAVKGASEREPAPEPPVNTEPPPNWFALPEKLENPETSGLTHTLTAGPNTHNIAIP